MIEQYLDQAQRNADAGNYMDALRDFGLVWLSTVSTVKQRRKALDGIVATMKAQGRTEQAESFLTYGRTHLLTLTRRAEFEQPLVNDDAFATFKHPSLPPLEQGN